jgi:serine/threonine protein phosphatase 1
MLTNAQSSAPAPSSKSLVASLSIPQRVWAIGSVYGRYGSLCQMHEAFAKHIRLGDRIVYLGNYLGAPSQWSGEGRAVMGELIAFRSAVLRLQGFKPTDIVYLRGQNEDLCEQLLRLPFQKDPKAWVAMAMEKGLGAYLAAYDVNPQALIDAADNGPFVANRFTYYWKKIMASHGEHEAFYAGLVDAAHTQSHLPLAFIPAGLDARLPLVSQRDTLCWPEDDIAPITRYFNYARIVRGQGSPTALPNFVLTLDGGHGLDGVLNALCVDVRGNVIESLTF